MPRIATPVTLRSTFSFYVGDRSPERIRLCARGADAVVVSGPNGPASVSRLRAEGWDTPVLFDRAAYRDEPGGNDGPAWIAMQSDAGCDRILTPGCWVSASSTDSGFADQAGREADLAAAHQATCVLAIDHRWLTQSKRFDEMTAMLKGLDVPVALILGDGGDPLRYQGSVDSLVALTTSVRGLTFLRIDHAGIGALAFDAAHAGIGLQASHRHAVPPGTRAAGIPHDRTARVFVPDLMDWFTVSTIGGWSTTRVSPKCQEECCDGQEIVRFLDDRIAPEADLHNRTVLTALSERVLEVPESADRRRFFGSMCARALENYGSMGNLVNEIKPKPQLTQWATYS